MTWMLAVLPRLRIRKMIAVIIYHSHHLMIRAMPMKGKNTPLKAKGNVRNSFFHHHLLLLRDVVFHLSNIFPFLCVRRQSTVRNSIRATFKSPRFSSLCYYYRSTSTARSQHGPGCVYTNWRSKEVHER